MANNQTRAALYIRGSTAEQAKEGYSVGVQEERLRSLATARGWNVVKAYVDPGHSGGTIERPQSDAGCLSAAGRACPVYRRRPHPTVLSRHRG